MPELPEVESVCRTLRPHLTGKKIARATVHWARTVEPLVVPSFRRKVEDRTIAGVARRGKYIVLSLSGDVRMTVHLRMTGELRYFESNSAQKTSPNDYLRVEFAFAGGESLRFYDIRKFGRIRVLDSREWAEFDQELGWEPLDPDFRPSILKHVLQSRRRIVKALLLDQTVIAGLGNIYIDEALFRARIHPLQPSDSISTVKINRLHTAIREILNSAIDRRGTTLRNYRSGLGEPGENQQLLRVYGSATGAPCPRCGRGLRRTTVSQRTTTFCPNCQRLKPARSNRR